VPEDVDTLIAEVAEQNSLELAALLPTVAARAQEKKALLDATTNAVAQSSKPVAPQAKVGQAI